MEEVKIEIPAEEPDRFEVLSELRGYFTACESYASGLKRGECQLSPKVQRAVTLTDLRCDGSEPEDYNRKVVAIAKEMDDIMAEIDAALVKEWAAISFEEEAIAKEKEVIEEQQNFFLN